jgi:hypothetical protein
MALVASFLLFLEASSAKLTLLTISRSTKKTLERGCAVPKVSKIMCSLRFRNAYNNKATRQLSLLFFECGMGVH